MNWKNKLTNALAVSALLLASPSAHAGIYTWSAPTPISTAETTLGQPGTIVGAAVFGNDEKLVVLSTGTTIHFTTDGSVATATGFGTAYGGFTNNTGNAAFNGALTQFNYDGGPKTITLNNLVIGQQYSVQLFACDRRDGIASTRVGNYQDPNDAGNVSANFQMGDYAYVIGTFTAGNPSESIQMNLLNSNGGNINALVLRAIGTNVPPQITVQPQPANIYNGLKANLVAAASGTGPITYQWQKGTVGSGIFTNLPNGGTVSGATSNQLTITSLVAGNTGDYRVIATSAYGSATSAPPATLTVLAGAPQFAWADPVAITTADATLTQAGTVVGAEVFGATETTVTLTSSATIVFKTDGSVATASGFGTFNGAFSGDTGNANFNAVLSQFNYDGGPKTITLNNLTIGQQYSVQLFALDNRTGGDGAAPFRRANYQDPGNPNNISSTFAMGDNVYVVGTFTANNTTVSIQQNLLPNGGGNVNALVVRAIGLVAPQIASAPQGGTLNQSLNKAFKVVATGTAPISYRWQRGAVGSGIFTNVPNDVRITGQTGTTLTITNLAVSDTADYQVVVTNLAGAVTSTPPATLTVDPATPLFVWSLPATITTADVTLNQAGSVVGAQVFGATPKVVVLGNGSSIDFKNDGGVATATGDGTFAGAFSGNTGNADFNAVLNQASYDGGVKTITLNNLVIGQQYAVQLFALDNRGGATGRRVNYQDPGNASDLSATVTMGENAYIIGTFTAPSTSVALQENLLDGGGNVNALVLRRLTGLPVAPQITTTPASKLAYAGTPAQLTVGANGSSLVYQWQRGAVGSGTFTNVSNGGNISGATSAQIGFSPLAVGDTADYRVIVSNGAGSVTSAPPATVTALANPPASLIHRWNFNEASGTTATDSVGGAHGTLQGGAVFNNGMLSLQANDTGNPQFGANSYVSIPGGLVSALTAVTFESWTTNNGLNNGNAMIGFGGPIDGGTFYGTNYLNWFLRWSGSVNGFQITTYAGDSGVVNLGTRQQPGVFHWVLTYDPIIASVRLYLNGNLFASASGVTVPLNTVGTTVGYIGLSAWNQEIGLQGFGFNANGNYPYLRAEVDEVRIYSGALTAAEVAATQLLGPNQLLSNAATLSVSNNAGNIHLTWPLVNGGFTLESSPTVGTGAVWTPVSGTPAVVGANYRVIVGSTNSAFFRLKK